MEVYGMLSKQGLKNLALLKEYINRFWGNKAQITSVEIQNAPFDMFKIYVLAYGHCEILLDYDRSIVDISIKRDDRYTWLTDMTTDDIIEGFESCKTESLLHNFKILDKTLKDMAEQD